MSLKVAWWNFCCLLRDPILEKQPLVSVSQVQRSQVASVTILYRTQQWVNTVKAKRRKFIKTLTCLIIRFQTIHRNINTVTFFFLFCEHAFQPFGSNTLNSRMNQSYLAVLWCRTKLFLIKVIAVVASSQAYQPSILWLTGAQWQKGAPWLQVPAIMMALYCL